MKYTNKLTKELITVLSGMLETTTNLRIFLKIPINPQKPSKNLATNKKPLTKNFVSG